jgi:hypothetical protein
MYKRKIAWTPFDILFLACDQEATLLGTLQRELVRSDTLRFAEHVRRNELCFAAYAAGGV